MPVRSFAGGRHDTHVLVGGALFRYADAGNRAPGGRDERLS